MNNPAYIVKHLRSFSRELIFLVTLITAITVLFFAVVYLPSSNAVKRIKTEVERLGNEILNQKTFARQSESDAKRLSELIGTMNGIESQLMDIKQQIFPAKEASNLLKEIATPSAGLTLASVQTAPLVDKGEYVIMPVTLQLNGSFAGIGNYLTLLESSKKMIRVENIAITKDQDSEHSLKIELNAYLTKDGGI